MQKWDINPILISIKVLPQIEMVEAMRARRRLPMILVALYSGIYGDLRIYLVIAQLFLQRVVAVQHLKYHTGVLF